MNINESVVFKAGPNWHLHKILELNGVTATIEDIKHGNTQVLDISWLRKADPLENHNGFRKINPSNYLDKHAHYWRTPENIWNAKYFLAFDEKVSS